MRYERYVDTSNMTYEEMSAHYREIELAAEHSLPATEITEEQYYDALGCLPPIYVPGGFLVCEALTGDVYAMYSKQGDRYFAKYVIRGKEFTYIQPHAARNAYALS